jgi:hypothetical protein
MTGMRALQKRYGSWSATDPDGVASAHHNGIPSRNDAGLRALLSTRRLKFRHLHIEDVFVGLDFSEDGIRRGAVEI